MRRTRSARTAALAAATLLVAACGGSDAEAPPAAPAPPEAAPATPVTTGAPVDAPAALQFTAPLVGGGELDAAAYAGQPVLFWFWAPY